MLFNRFVSFGALFATAAAHLVIPQAVLDHHDQVLMEPSPADGFIRGPVLSDMLALESQASIFFSYARESAKVSGVLSGLGEFGGNQYTVFVPTNKAVMALSRKPHQPSGNDDVEITDEEADRRSAEKVEKWISAHIIPGAAELKEGTHQTLLDGKSLTFTHLDSKSPEWSNWKVDSYAILAQRKASNGIMYLIDGAVEV